MKSGADTAPPPGRSSGPARWASPVALLLLALLYRLGALLALPVAHDEINVLAYGLTRASLGGGLRDLLLEIPITVSNGITPLWFWLQALPAWLFGVTSKAGLRLLPLLLGLWGTALAWRAAKRFHGRRAGWWCGLAWAVMSLMLYTNGRGEFAESLIAPLLLLQLLALAPRRRSAIIPLRAALPSALILFTYFGKGLPIWGAYAACLAILALLSKAGRTPSRGLAPGRLAALILLPLLPSLLWLGTAQAFLFESGDPIVTDSGFASTVGTLIWNLTVGYGTAVKEFMTAGPAEALYLYTHFQTWPILALLVVPGVAGILMAARSLLRGLRTGQPRSVERALVPLILALPILALLVMKGAFSARFHLLYIPLLLPAAAGAVDRWLDSLAERRVPAFLGWGAAAAAWLAWSASWMDRFQGRHDGYHLAWVLTIGLLALVLLLLATRRLELPGRRAAGAVFLTGLVLLAGGLFGLSDWGRRLAWEPELRPTRPDAVETLPNPELQLVRYTIGRDRYIEQVRSGRGTGSLGDEEEASYKVVRRVRPLLLRALERHPGDPATLHDAGVALYKYSPEDRPRVLGLWKEHLRRDPDARRIRRALEQVEGRGAG